MRRLFLFERCWLSWFWYKKEVSSKCQVASQSLTVDMISIEDAQSAQKWSFNPTRGPARGWRMTASMKMVETWNLDLLNDLNTSQIGCFILKAPNKFSSFLPLAGLIFIHHISSSLGLPQRNGRLGIPGIAAPPHNPGLRKRSTSLAIEEKKLEST